MTLILITIFFVLYFTYIGAFTCHLFDKQLYWVNLKFPIGLMVTFGTLQLVSFPLLYLHVSMTTIIICFISILILLFVCATGYFIKNCPKMSIYGLPKHIKKNLFLVGMVIGFVSLHLALTFITNSLNVASSDQSFYITLVKNNIGASQINTIYPVTGQVRDLHLYYNFQSYFLFLSFISQVFNLEALAVTAWFYPVLLLTFIATSIVNVCCYMNIKNKFTIASFFIITFMFNFWAIENVVKYNTYNGPLRAYIFVFIFILYYEGYKTKKFNHWLINIVWLAASAVQSTALFNGYILLASLVLYELFIAKRKVIFELFKSSIALHIYVFFFLRYSWHYKLSTLWAIAILAIFVISKVPKWKSWCEQIVYHKNMQRVIIIGYCSLIVLSLILFNYGFLTAPISSDYFIEYLNGYYFNNTYYSSIVSSLLNTSLKLFLILFNIYLVSKVTQLKEQLKFFVWLQIILVIVFYNPLVSPFISTFITGSVYFRMRDIIFSIPLIVTLLCYISSQLKSGKAILRILTVLTLGLGLINIYEYISYKPNHIDDFSQYSFYYRLPKDTVNVSEFLDQYIDKYYTSKNERPKVYSTNRQINYFSNKYEMVYTINQDRRFNSIDLRQNIIYGANEYVLEGLVTQLQEYKEYLIKYRLLLRVYKVDFVVLNNDVDEVIKNETLKDYNLIYSNPTFSVYELKG